MKKLLNVEIGRVQANDITADDLDQIKKHFDEGIHKDGVPLTIGHPAFEDTGAKGWAFELERKGTRLIMNSDHVSDELIGKLDRKELRNRSMGIYRDYHADGTNKVVLQHVAFLGAMTPRLRGMSPNYKVEENSLKLSQKGITQITQDLETFSYEVADMKTEEEPKKEQQKKESKMEETLTYSEDQFKASLKVELDKQKVELSEQIKVKDSEIVKLNDNIKTLNLSIEGKEEKIKELNDKIVKDEIENFTSGLIKDGKLEPKNKEETVIILNKAGEEVRELLKKQYSDREKILNLDENLEHLNNDNNTSKNQVSKSVAEMNGGK